MKTTQCFKCQKTNSLGKYEFLVSDGWVCVIVALGKEETKEKYDMYLCPKHRDEYYKLIDNWKNENK